jgi:hypothetical protein
MSNMHPCESKTAFMLRGGLVLGALLAMAIAAQPVGADQSAVLQRLQEGDLTLDGVAKAHVEVGMDDLLGLARPMTQRIPIQAQYHPDPVAVHPELSLTLGSTLVNHKHAFAVKEANAIGFALGTPARLPELTEAVHNLHKGYQPIVESRWKLGAITLDRIAFGVLPDADAVVTGKERQDIVIRISVTNGADAPATTALVLLTGRADGNQTATIGYGPFLAPVSRWQHKEMKVATAPGTLLADDRIWLAYHSSVPTPVEFLPSFPAVQGKTAKPVVLNNGLRFALKLQPKETRTIDFVVASNSKLYPASERERLAAVNFEQSLARAESHWDRVLQPGMKLVTPEPKLNDIYKHLILSTNMCKEPDTNWIRPNHFFSWPEAIWPWEFVRVSLALDSLGYHNDMKACLQYFVEHQSGVGKHGKDIASEGEVQTTRGCFVGEPIRWMCTTGSVLSSLAGHYRYSRDAAWLKANRPAILAAWDWIQTERKATRTLADDGTKVAHFGLLPKGRVHDWKGHRYHYCFSDGTTWRGMADMAVAFREAGLPDANRLVREADEYRQCILDVLHRVEYTDPDTGLLSIPNTVYYRQGERGGVWLFDGPRALFDVGLLDAVRDVKYWDSMLTTIQRRFGVLGGLLGHFSTSEDQATVQNTSPFYYCNQAEMNYFRNFLARGETEKALLVLYSNLAYGMSPDLYQTVERVNVRDSNFAPFQPNASGNGRVLDMMRRMVIDEQDEAQGLLWLLRGCPRRWFAPGKAVVVENAPTLFGTMAIRTAGFADTVTIDIDPPAARPLKQLRIAVRHPNRQKARSVTVNGTNTAIQSETITLPSPSGHLHIVAQYDSASK